MKLQFFKNSIIRKCFGVSLLVVISVVLYSYGCGGGVVPYVPTQTGASSSALTGQFFIFEKGIAINMFDVKKFQPIFRNIILTGNERTEHKTMKTAKKKQKADTNKGISDTVKVTCDASAHAEPVLNIHRLH